MIMFAQSHTASADRRARHEAQLLVMDGQVEAALSKLQLLQSLGLTHTAGYTAALKAYEDKRAAVEQFKAQLT